MTIYLRFFTPEFPNILALFFSKNVMAVDIN